jgi:hypothetical protein
MSGNRTIRAVALASLLAGLCLPGVAAAQGHGAPVTSNKGGEARGSARVDSRSAPLTSNSGGDLRGTARADERAGAHGDQGRDHMDAKAKAKGKAAK